MKRALLSALTALVVAGLMLFPTARAGEPAAADKPDFALKHLKESRDALVAATNGFSEAQWNFRESPERWSAAEIAEHLAASEDLLFGLITDRVMKTEKMAEPLPNAEEADQQLVEFLADRSQKFQAPEPLQPTNRFETPQKAMEHFLAARARTIEFLKTTPDLRLYAMAGPGGQKRDAYQWLLFISGHTVRHTKQLQQVKDDPNFPKN
jgi:hypothetical protein